MRSLIARIILVFVSFSFAAQAFAIEANAPAQDEETNPAVVGAARARIETLLKNNVTVDGKLESTQNVGTEMTLSFTGYKSDPHMFYAKADGELLKKCPHVPQLRGELKNTGELRLEGHYDHPLWANGEEIDYFRLSFPPATNLQENGLVGEYICNCPQLGLANHKGKAFLYLNTARASSGNTLTVP